MYDAQLSSYFRSNIVENSSKVLKIFEEVKKNITNISNIEEEMLQTLARLYIPYKKILGNEELEKFINYSEFRKNSKKFQIHPVLPWEHPLNLAEKVEKLQKKPKKLPSLTKMIELN